MNTLQLKNINKHYGMTHALKNFSFTFHNGVYALLGPNGAGKSTLMNLITDNLKPDKDGGMILWNGNEIRKLGKDYRKILGFMPQQQELYATMTAWDFMGYISSLKKIPKVQRKSEIESALKLVELEDFANKKIGGFSGGMKQRLLIAQTLIGNPELIIMDEPTAGLDPKQRVIVRKLTEKLGKEKIVVVSTHIISDIESIADNIVMIKQGELIESGTVDTLIEKVQSPEKNLENLYMQYYGGSENVQS
jgi:ABC-type multidrug transport system ATPase subunit